MIKFKKQYLENILFVFFSFLLSPFFYGMAFLHKTRKRKQLRILVIQTAKIGDLVCSTPVFREIKNNYPKSYLSVLIIPRVEGILINNPHIDEIIVFDQEKYSGIRGILKLIKEIRKKDFDWSFSLLPGILSSVIPFWAGIPNRVVTTSKHTTRGAKILSIFNNYKLEYQRHTLALKHYLNLLKFIGIDKVSEKKEIFIKSDQNEKAVLFLEKHNFKLDDFLIGISPAAGNKFKEWAPDKFAKLADRLIEELSAKVVFTGSPQESLLISQIQSRMTQKSIDSSQSFSLAEVPALFKYFKIFISVDTGSMYIANAMGVPVVDIAGPIDIYEQPPLDDKCEIVQKKMDCLPCSFVIPPARFCKKGHRQCIENIEVDDVWQAVNKLIKKNLLKL